MLSLHNKKSYLCKRNFTSWPTYHIFYLPLVITSIAVTMQKFPVLRIFFFCIIGNSQPAWTFSFLFLHVGDTSRPVQCLLGSLSALITGASFGWETALWVCVRRATVATTFANPAPALSTCCGSTPSDKLVFCGSGAELSAKVTQEVQTCHSKAVITLVSFTHFCCLFALFSLIKQHLPC